MAIGDGLISMRPTSISYVGTSAGINGDDGINFEAITSLSLNGIFTSLYSNYIIYVRMTSSLSSGGTPLFARYRSSGLDESGANYNYQSTYGTGATGAAFRLTAQTEFRFAAIGPGAATPPSFEGFINHIYGPFLSQTTVQRGSLVRGSDSGILQDFATIHSLSTSYDGITIYITTTDNITGSLHVFGYEE